MRLDEDQFKWLSRTVTRKATSAAVIHEQDEKLMSERQLALWTKLAAKFEQQQLDMSFTKHEVKAMRTMTVEQMIVLMGTTIPEYQKRQRTEPDKSNHYQEYIDKAKASVAGLESIINLLGEN